MTLSLPIAFLIVVTVPYLAGYLCGSIPFGLILPKLAGYGDVRATGSGNIGATNVLRLAGKKIAAATLACDLLKGTAGVFLGWGLFHVLMDASPIPPFDTSENIFLFGGASGGIGAFLGHLYPVWLRFKGGKGVATLIGVLLGLDWRLAVAFCGCWLAVAWFGRISSLAALTSACFIALLAWIAKPPVMAAAISVMTLLVLVRHRENIARLRRGEEPKIGAGKTATKATGASGDA